MEVRVVDDAAYIDGLTALYVKANPKAAEDPNFKNMFRNAPAVIFIASPSDGSGQLDCGLLVRTCSSRRSRWGWGPAAWAVRFAS